MELYKEYKKKIAAGSLLPNHDFNPEEEELSDKNPLFNLIDRLQNVELKFLPSEKEGIPDDYSFFL